jgi:hypothetical protein
MTHIEKFSTPARPTPPAAAMALAQLRRPPRYQAVVPAAGAGTNPEQMFAAGWSACFIGAMGAPPAI